MAEKKILKRGDRIDDSGAKNIWRWTWLEKTINDELLAQYIRKLAACGLAYCELCRVDINYAARGRVALDAHVSPAKHKKAKSSASGNTTLDGNPRKEKPVYGLHPMFASQAAPVLEDEREPFTPPDDRKKNAEATVVSFIAENSLSLAMAPKLIELSKSLAKDKYALDNLTMDSSTASYKLKYGVARTFEEELVDELKETPFALNLDEAMNSNNQKIVTVLVSFFSSSALLSIILHHL